MNLPGKHDFEGDRLPIWTRRQAIWLIVGAVGGGALHACTQPTPSPSDNTTSASMGIVTWVGLTPLHIAREKGFFKELGLNLDIKEFSSIPDSNAALVAGRLNGVAPVTSEAVLLAATGADFRVVMVEDISVGADGILARKNIKEVKDFKGKRIAVEKGSVSHFFLLQVLNEAGLSEKDVTIVSMLSDQAAVAYQSGKIDVAVTYSPFLEQANTAQKDGRVIYDSSKMPGAILDLYVFDTKFIETYPKAVEAFVRGIFKGLEFLQTNRPEGLAIAAKRLQITPAELDANLKILKLPDIQTNIDMLSNPQSPLYVGKKLIEMAQFMKAQKQIKQLPDMSKFIEPKFVKAML